MGHALNPPSRIGLFKQAEFVQAPVISERDVNGSVTISGSKGLPVVYTTDGTAPTSRSAVYDAPIELSRGGSVQAASLARNGRLGMMTSKYFAGLAPTGWKVVSPTQESDQTDNSAVNAIDGNPNTIWETHWNANSTLPHQLTIDMGSLHRIAGFTYLPRQDRSHEGVVTTYRFETSVDGHDWTTDVDSGSFGNVENNPVLQEVPFAPVNARFFRLTVVQELGTKGLTSAAEISVLPASGDGDR